MSFSPIRLLAVLSVASLCFGLQLASPGGAHAHCQIPCGIYDDAARIARLKEDASTIRKSVSMMAELAAKTDVQSRNQFSRWVANKESHASHIIEVVSEYFLAQKVKPVSDTNAKAHSAYLKKLGDHHAVIVAAMKTKQNADAESVDALDSAISALSAHYAEHKH